MTTLLNAVTDVINDIKAFKLIFGRFVTYHTILHTIRVDKSFKIFNVIFSIVPIYKMLASKISSWVSFVFFTDRVLCCIHAVLG